VTPRKPNLSRQPTNPSASNSGHAAGDENRVGATENSRSHHPKTAPQAARSSKRCIMQASLSFFFLSFFEEEEEEEE
jgi:hypothetical protein